VGNKTRQRNPALKAILADQSQEFPAVRAIPGQGQAEIQPLGSQLTAGLQEDVKAFLKYQPA